MSAGSVKSSTLSRGFSSLLVKEDRKKTIQISDFPLLLHLLLLTPSSSLFLCLSSQQGGEARLTNWTKSEWIAEGQRRAWVGAMPVGRCSQQHNTRWRRLSSGVRPSRAKVTGLIRSEVNGRRLFHWRRRSGNRGMRKEEFTCLKSSEGEHVFFIALYLTRRDADKNLTSWWLMVRVTTHITHAELQKRRLICSETHAGQT